ncbi:Bacilysin biosynthesis oxidoreductase BacC [Rhizoctonia solani AG-1 IB]|uniref:Bacilysin biosynthesis oxidoreductase BacC n=1 Tax=Thanatephorus cucumeris (strain AG1-IB / isolate 7/3/14) TaxID=1108050 RepID=M5CGP2_THACB|nr:Bacilysin biosynthesis oxidoreductase BacC [Rhizoctonia solani AG-1 IB]
MSLIGVPAALEAASDPSVLPKRKIFDEFSLTGKVAVVTGGNQGLGLEIALAIAEAGAVVYVFDIAEHPGDHFTAAAEYIKKLGGALNYFTVDVTQQKIVWDKFEAIGSIEGRMDICFAAAGICETSPFLECKATNFQRIMDVNANGVLFTAQGAGRQMTRLGTPGSIILISSIAGSGTTVTAYQASKAAVLQMGRSMAAELGPHKIRVNTISPGMMDTKLAKSTLNEETKTLLINRNTLGRIGRPEEIRGVAVWLASDASSFCTGSEIVMDGGHRVW